MLGFKNLDYAATTIAGVELLYRIRKCQFALHRLRLKDQTAPAIWNAVLAAKTTASPVASMCIPQYSHQS
jgi:transposase, IS6 family